VYDTGLLLAKTEDLKEKSVARIISIQFIPEKKINERIKIPVEEETVLFYTKPIFRAKKYEFF
jgi:hypothetical protein